MNTNTEKQGKVFCRTLPGFTIIEVMAVLIIVMLLLAIFVPSIIILTRSARVTSSKSTVALLASGCEQYFSDHGVYPRTGSAQLVVDLTGMEHPNPAYNIKPTICYTTNTVDIEPGPGFRLVARGQLYGPYCSAEEIEIVRTSDTFYFVDSLDNPILYYLAKDTDGDGFGDLYEPGVGQVADLDYPAYLTMDATNKNGFLYHQNKYAILTPGFSYDSDNDGAEELWDKSVLTAPSTDVTNISDSK